MRFIDISDFLPKVMLSSDFCWKKKKNTDFSNVEFTFLWTELFFY